MKTFLTLMRCILWYRRLKFIASIAIQPESHLPLNSELTIH